MSSLVSRTKVWASLKDLGKVFERFIVWIKHARAQGGTGLGLAISKEVIRAHNGSIWVESTEGEGSTFYISLTI